MMLSDLQTKDIINLHDGKKVGSIIDVDLDEKGMVVELVVQKKKFIFFSGGISRIKWNQIDKIGKDVILVSVGN